jgi:hypothetical protein
LHCSSSRARASPRPVTIGIIIIALIIIVSCTIEAIFPVMWPVSG